MMVLMRSRFAQLEQAPSGDRVLTDRGLRAALLRTPPGPAPRRCRTVPLTRCGALCLLLVVCLFVSLLFEFRGRPFTI